MEQLNIMAMVLDDNSLDSLLHRYVEQRKKLIYGDYYNGDVDKFLKEECNHWSGCYCGDFHWDHRPKQVTIGGKRGSKEYTLSAKEFSERIK